MALEHPAAHISLPEHVDVADDIELRLLEVDESVELFAIVQAQRSQLREWLPWVDTTIEVNDSLAFIQATREQFLQKTALTFGIIVHKSIAGVITLRSLDWPNRSAEIGYWLSRDFEGRGVMIRSCRSLVTCAFRRLGMHRIVIRCGTENRRSRAIPEKLGFVREGLSRQAEYLNGTFIDLVVYSLLSSEWKTP